MRLVFSGMPYYSASDAGFFLDGEARDLPEPIAARLLRDFPEYFQVLHGKDPGDNLDYSDILSLPAHDLISKIRGGQYDQALRPLAGQEQQSDYPRKSVLEAMFSRLKKIGG